jgi:hypothetical protein
MAGRRTFVAGEVLTASNINGFLMNQVVAVFDDAAARDAAIASPQQGNLVYLKDTDQVQRYTGTAWAPITGGFTARAVITATDSSWPVPSLASPIVKVTAVGGGGGGGGIFSNDNPGVGGTTTFNASTAGTVTALGGVGGSQARTGAGSFNGATGRAGLTAGNQGIGGVSFNQDTLNYSAGTSGGGGEVKVAYLDLSSISTVNVTVGAGGSGGGTIGNASGGAGGAGEVIVEYVAA